LLNHQRLVRLEGSRCRAKPSELVEFKTRRRTGQKPGKCNVGAGAPYAFSPDTDGEAIVAAGREGKVVKLDLASPAARLWRIDAGTDRSPPASA
jgi:hypothetical protein